MNFEDVELTSSEKTIVKYLSENDAAIYAHRFMIWAQQIQRDLDENLSYSDTDIFRFKKAFKISDNDPLYQKCVDLEFNRFKVVFKGKDTIYLDIDIPHSPEFA